MPPDKAATLKRLSKAGIKAHLELLGRLIHETDGEQPKGKAMAILSMMVGALTLLRVVNTSISPGPFWCGSPTGSRSRRRLR